MYIYTLVDRIRWVFYSMRQQFCAIWQQSIRHETFEHFAQIMVLCWDGKWWLSILATYLSSFIPLLPVYVVCRYSTLTLTPLQSFSFSAHHTTDISNALSLSWLCVFIRWGAGGVYVCVNLCFRYFTHLLVSHFLSYHTYTCGHTRALANCVWHDFSFSFFLFSFSFAHIYTQRKRFASQYTKLQTYRLHAHTNKPNDRCEHVDEFYTGSHISLELCCNLLLAVRVSLPITNEIKIHNNSAKCISHTVEHIY